MSEARMENSMNNKKYKTALHCLTEGGAVAETLESFVEAGYTSVAVTNSLYHSRIGAKEGDSFAGYDTYEAYVTALYDEIDRVRLLADGKINVLSGLNLKNKWDNAEFLIYGLSREDALAFDLCSHDIEDAHDYLKKRGGVVINAHPMRMNYALIRPDFVDGYEVYNPCDPDYVNTMTRQWVLNIGAGEMILTAGTDHCGDADHPQAGIVTSKPIETDAELVRVLKDHDFDLFY